jgi:hypothetical protein
MDALCNSQTQESKETTEAQSASWREAQDALGDWPGWE